MTKSEMLANWKKTSALKANFSKILGERFPHLCYTDAKLLEKVNSTLESLAAELAKVKDGEADKPVKAKKEEAEVAEADTKVAETEVKVTEKAKAKTKKDEKVNA